MPRNKRRRGGQPGNQNARKHGVYAVNLSPEDINELCTLINQGDVDPALAVIRMKFAFIAQQASSNRRLLREVSGRLHKWMFSHYTCSRRERTIFRKFVREFRESILNGAGSLPEPTGAKL
jgi:hypothetical protein